MSILRLHYKLAALTTLKLIKDNLSNGTLLGRPCTSLALGEHGLTPAKKICFCITESPPPCIHKVQRNHVLLSFK